MSAIDPAGLRNQALALHPDDLDLASTAEHPRVWAVLMETGVADRAATLVAVADGTVSLYFSTGGGMLGAGDHAEVRQPAGELIKLSEEFVEEMVRTTEYPLPGDGRVRFYLRTFTGTYTAEADGTELGAGRHSLSPLFIAGHRVISAMRTLDDRRPT